ALCGGAPEPISQSGGRSVQILESREVRHELVRAAEPIEAATDLERPRPRGTHDCLSQGQKRIGQRVAVWTNVKFVTRSMNIGGQLWRAPRSPVGPINCINRFDPGSVQDLVNASRCAEPEKVLECS